jgi:hypothetical protein
MTNTVSYVLIRQKWTVVKMYPAYVVAMHQIPTATDPGQTKTANVKSRVQS